MPQFNPELPDAQNPDGNRGYSGYSEGIRVQKAQEQAPSLSGNQSAYYKAKAKAVGTEGYGQILKGVIDTADYLTQTYIGDELRSQKESVDNEFGVGAAAATQSDATSPTAPTPEGLETAYKQVEGVTAGYQSGRLKESHYWARLESITRQMKARFPGYKDEIDRKIAGLSGSTPANALRDQLQREATAADKTRDDRAKLVERVALDGSLYNAPELTGFNADAQPGDKGYFSDSEILAATGKWHALISRQGAEQSAIGLKDSQGKLDKNEAMSVAKPQIMDLWNNTFTKSVYATGMGMDPFIKDMNDANAKKGKGQALTQDEEDKLRSDYNIFQANSLASVDNFLNQDFPGKPGVSWRSVINDEEKIKELKAPFVEKLAQYEKALTDQNYGWFAANANYVKATGDAVGARLLSKDSGLQLSAGISKILGANGLPLVLSNQNGLLNALDSSINMELQQKTVLGQTTSLTAEFDKWQAEGLTSPAAYTAAIQNHVAMLTDPNMPKNEQTNIAKAMYGPANLEMMAKWPEQKKLSVYRSLTSPEVQKTMEDIKSTNPQAYGWYRNWVSHNFSELFRTDLMNASEALSINKYAKLEYDPKTMQFTPSKLESPEQSSALQSYYDGKYRQLDNTITKINEELKGVTPILTSDQKDPGTFLGDLVKEMGLDPHLIQKGSLTSDLLEAIYRNTHTKSEDTQKIEAQGAF